MPVDPITNQELKEAFFSLKTNKSAGYDEVSLNFIKNYHTILVRKLEMYGIKGINLGHYPDNRFFQKSESASCTLQVFLKTFMIKMFVISVKKLFCFRLDKVRFEYS